MIAHEYLHDKLTYLNTNYKYISYFLYLLSICISFILSNLLLTFLKRFTKKDTILSFVLTKLKIPLRFLTVAVISHYFIKLLHLPETFHKLLFIKIIVISISISIIISQSIDILIYIIEKETPSLSNNLNAIIFRSLRNTLKTVLFVLTIIIVPMILIINKENLLTYVSFSTTTVLAIIGYILKDFFKGLFNIVIIISSKTFLIGDQVLINEIEGTVHAINIFFTKIKTKNNTIVTLSNSNLLSKSIHNYSNTGSVAKFEN